ncbi:Coq4 family protein [Novosphingobium bradum]|uniref:Coq4 family protein n=1 Tax=Novosphingobium bradum TaxID=1737444 RepID=A0ABV7IW73_9SPHN
MTASTGKGLPAPRMLRPFSKAETAYLTGGTQPAVSSVLTSSSKFLNSPLFRDAWAMTSLRRMGPDLPLNYCQPAMFRAVYDVIDPDEFCQAVEAEKAGNPEFRDWLGARRIAHYDPAAMAHNAPGTLGAAIRDFLLNSGMKIEFRDQREIDNDVDYILIQRAHTHDIQHIVTGYGANDLGELALATATGATDTGYFTPALAHFLNLIPNFICAARLMRSQLHYPAAMPHVYDALADGIALGKAVRLPLFMVDWEARLDQQLDAIATDLGFTRRDDSHWRDLDHLSRG